MVGIHSLAHCPAVKGVEKGDGLYKQERCDGMFPAYGSDGGEEGPSALPFAPRRRCLTERRISDKK